MGLFLFRPINRTAKDIALQCLSYLYPLPLISINGFRLTEKRHPLITDGALIPHKKSIFLFYQLNTPFYKPVQISAFEHSICK
jgi:hypothetical protein